MAKNPFLSIVPSENEDFVEVVNFNEVESKVKENNIIFVVGKAGSGKSHLILEIKRRFGGKILHFSRDLIDKIRETHDSIIYIEDFDLIRGLTDDQRYKLLELIQDKSQMGIKFVIEVTPKTLNGLNLEGEKIYIPEIDFETAREIVERKLKREGVKNPFTEDEMKNIWKKSGKNPRMFLMLLATMYDLKVNS